MEPISPVRSAEGKHRQDSLEKHLQQRPTKADLKDRGILYNSDAAPYVPPPPPSLNSHSPHPSPCCPHRTPPIPSQLTSPGRDISALQQAAHDLERQRTADSLNHALAARPERDMLVDRNILSGSSAAPAVQEKQRELERHRRADSLSQKLKDRPDVQELIRAGVMSCE